ncbi:MAG: ABC transporter ATP-binding protein [Thermomicrobiales bacterium]
MQAIRFEHVSKQFPGAARAAVDDCSLEVEAGSFVCLVGPSGCGKTTLLKMVNRLYEPTGGTIFVEGTEIRQLPVTKLRRQIGYVIQQVGLFPHMTVAKNIAVVPQLLGWGREKIAARTDELLTLIGLPPEEYRARYPAQLSGGQQQRVGLARALAADPALMLMDEPFGAIDAITRTGLQDEMARLQQTLKKTILFVTHDVEEALRLGDMIVVMRDGRIVQHGTPLSVLTQPADPFVHDLLGADDMVRQLGLLRVEETMEAITDGVRRADGPTIGRHDDLRHALSLLLRTAATTLTVMDGERAVGTLTLEQIHRAVLTGETDEVHRR